LSCRRARRPARFGSPTDRITDRTALVSIMARTRDRRAATDFADCRYRKITGLIFRTDAARPLHNSVRRRPRDWAIRRIPTQAYAPIIRGIGALLRVGRQSGQTGTTIQGGGQRARAPFGNSRGAPRGAMGAAAEIAKNELGPNATSAASLRQLFLDIVATRIPSSIVNAAGAPTAWKISASCSQARCRSPRGALSTPPGRSRRTPHVPPE